ncbi:MAG: ABC transporter ATP-binding protein [Clostridia bacterium]
MKNKVRKEFTSKFYERNITAFSAALIGIIVSSALDIAVAYILQELLDSATGTDTARLVSLMIFSAVFFAVIAVNEFILRETKNRFLRKAMKQYKEHVFNKITQKSIRSFANEKTSAYISALTNDAASIESNYLIGSLNLITQFILFFGALAMMFWYDWSMTLVVIGLSVIPITISLAFGGKLENAEKKVAESNVAFVGMVKDLLNGFAVIKSFKAEKEVEKLFDNNNLSLESVKMKRRKTDALIGIISGVTGGIVQISIFVYGAYLAIKGEITAGVVIAFVQLMNYVLSPVRQVPVLIANRKAATALIDKLTEEVEANTDKRGSIRINGIGDGIECKNLSFGYEPGELVIKDFNVKFEKGRSYAIVGASGSGKSTLLNLLLGSYDKYDGMITIDNTELREVSTESLYDTLSIIQQNVFVFDSSIEENITMFKDFDKERVHSAIVRSGLDQLISERGSSYQCGENGAGLSGGEKQRISIARCLLRNSPVLLMDEATASLDQKTAYYVTDGILNIQGLTRIIVTHKLDESLLKRYDDIIVMRNGYVTEQGTFDELISNKDYFYSLYNVTE